MESINIIKETRAGFSFIEKCVYETGGIIYGGYVRDEVTKDHFTDKFMKEHLKTSKKEKMKKYWDVNYHPETSDRLMIPVDIDIAFKDEGELQDFIEKINESSLIKVNKVEEENLYDHVGGNIIHEKYKLFSVIGKTFVNPGTIIMFNADVCVTEIEPPFYSCDMFTNCLVKDSNGIRISKNSGIFHNAKPYEIAMSTGKVIEMIIRKENYITISQPDSMESSGHIIKRISKMISKNYFIKNISWLKKCENDTEVCTICQEEKAEMSIKRGSHFHKKCLVEYFNHLEFFNDEGGFFFRSPLKETCYLRFIKEWV